MAKYLLVSFKTCPWVQRAAIVLREKGVAFEFRHIDRDNRPDWFLAMSPHKKVPVIRIDDKDSLFESNAINEYLDETVSPQLHPADPLHPESTYILTVTGASDPAGVVVVMSPVSFTTINAAPTSCLIADSRSSALSNCRSSGMEPTRPTTT